MPKYLCISVRFADPAFRGRGDGGEPEWPPSPLRLFQSLVAALAARDGNSTSFQGNRKPIFEWLAGLGAPLVVTPTSESGKPFRLAVPNNDMDAVAGPLSRGTASKFQPSQLKTLKTVSPTHMRGGDDFPAVHFVWPVPDDKAAELDAHKGTLVAAARSVTHLGWGVDMAVGNADVLDDDQLAKLDGERWRPGDAGGSVNLRVPRGGTFDALVSRHTSFLKRLDGGGFTPVPPLTAFRTVGYRRATDPEPRPFAAFRILSVDPDKPSPSFDTPRRAIHVAGWVRSATADVWGERPGLDSFVHGHADDGTQLRGDDADARFMYLPLPTINPKLGRVEAIRRVLVAAPPQFRSNVDFVRQRLAGQELTWDCRAIGMLAALPAADWVLRQYVEEAAVWSTVTPVLVRGHDDGKGRKAHRILQKAFVHAGLSAELVASAEIEWRAVGFRAGVELARWYAVPQNLESCHRYHVRVRFPHPLRGPLAIGAGRYRGLGVFAAHG